MGSVGVIARVRGGFKSLASALGRSQTMLPLEVSVGRRKEQRRTTEGKTASVFVCVGVCACVCVCVCVCVRACMVFVCVCVRVCVCVCVSLTLMSRTRWWSRPCN